MKLSRLVRLKPPRYVATMAGLVLASLAAFGFKLYSLMPGLAVSETALPTFKSSIASLWNQPIEAPLLISRAIVAAAFPSTGAILSRLPNVLLGITLVLVCFWLIKRWYGYRLAAFSMLLLITAPWLLHVTRIATNDIVYPLAMAVVMALAALWHNKSWRIRSLYVSSVLVAGLLYIPGAIWLLLIVIVFERKNILTAIKAQRRHGIIASGIGVLFLMPLVHGIFVNTGALRQLAGLPSAFPSIADYGLAFVQNWQYIFIGGFDDPVRNLGQLAVVNAFITLSFVIGIYLYAKHPKAARTRELLGLWVAGSALVALGGPVSYSLLLPIVLVLAIGGLGYLLHLWLKTFPRNPYARGFGIGLLGLVVLFAVAYNLRSYYVAWPNTPAVRAAFTRQL